MTQSYSPSYLGDREQEGNCLNGDTLGIPALEGSIKQQYYNPGWPEQKTRPYLQNNQSKQCQKHASSGKSKNSSKSKNLRSNTGMAKKYLINTNSPHQLLFRKNSQL